MEGICHGSGVTSDLDKGAPTYFRYDIEKANSGQSVSPGSAHAVLYSLQRTGGRFCDFKTYTDTEVCILLFSIFYVLNWYITLWCDWNSHLKLFFVHILHVG